ncbi:hypothetical protein P153DRAFT_351063 [Dothidotthia symphoricarpi CBS 119687]|uniref:Uncharacterized protein n=1 Tax=Dothidotthia symphoricarpi CBS 119687 TaxID=1392245 RepID=A0A6A5ZYW3_9PLEO|nr:uncharacterized protein P153DRAFT_351063 [Dothidotthia symphoricarpi CBS 119687]KAF2124215.1 hypothetical protein P153DRAFT_351063 [Dothidotthia symphoricarpi CBS 119687]
MFGKRRRAASNPPLPRVSPAPNASASVAATKAFLSSQQSNGALSSAAAAAALRSHTPTPTPVGDTVTKRMMRRGSMSSNGSAMPQRGGLERRGSSGSMTERSFRAGNPAEPVPPVPSVPSNLRGGGTLHRRSSSHEPVYRVASPGPRGGGRGMSLDRGAGDLGGRGQQRPASHLMQVVEDDQDDASPSVNFSRPMSPGAKPSPPMSHGWFAAPVVDQGAVQRVASPASQRRPHTSSGLTGYQAHETQHAIQSAANAPVKTHRTAYSVESARLAGGSMRAQPKGTAVQSRSFLPPATRQAPRIVDPKSPNAVYDPDTRSFIHKQDAMARHRELHNEPEQPAQHYVAHHIDSLRPHPVAQSGTSSRRSPGPLRPAVERPSTPPSSASYVAQLTGRPQQSARFAGAGADTDADSPRTVSTGPSRRSEDAPVTPARSTAASQDHASTRSANDSHLSPPRTAHFASVAVELGAEMHQPLPRSSSPSKPALKHSPSVSSRPRSPAASSGRLLGSQAASETSDTMSEDGFRRKKKNIRVSFDETPVVNSYTEPETPLTPPTLVSQSRDEFGDFMQPRPALPSFGSVRDKEPRRDQDDVPQKVTETVSTPMSASVSSVGDPLAASTDSALAGIMARYHAQRQVDASTRSESLAPGVTPNEGSGYASDSSTYSQATDKSVGIQKHGGSLESSQHSGAVGLESSIKPTVRDTAAPALPTSRSSENNADVPAIALLPATPRAYDIPEPKYQDVTTPGDLNDDNRKSQNKQTDYAPMAFKDVSVEPEQQTGIYSQQADNTDDDSSVYSDAYEDLTDAEGGFASIDAVANSPVISPSSGLLSSRSAESPSKLRQGTTAEGHDYADVTPMQGWDAARQHWSGLNQARQQSPLDESAVGEQSQAAAEASRALQASTDQQETHVQHQAMPEAAPRTSTSSQVSPSPSKPLKSALKKNLTPQSAPPAQPQMRNTMRGAAPNQRLSSGPQMKKTMRAGTVINPTSQPEHQMRKSMRTADSTPTPAVGLAASRYSTLPTEKAEPRGALQKRHIPLAPRPQSMAAPASTRATAPVPTYDSDSDASVSSFQRERAQKRAARNQGGQYTMRSSMRGSGPAPTMRASAPAPIRSISPPASPPPTLRRSLRPSSPTNGTAPSSRFSIRSLSPMGRFRNSKADDIRPSSPIIPKKISVEKQPKTKAPATMRSKASRFADSSDEDNDRPRRFQSRFADSDSDDPADYELPADLAPVRGIPRKAGTEDGDSTDLEEEEAENEPIPSAQSKAAANVMTTSPTNGNPNGQGTALSAGSLRDSKYAPTSPAAGIDNKVKAKRSFFGLGGRKKTSDSIASVSQTPSAQVDIPMPPQQRNRDLGLPLTPIDEDKDIGAVPLASLLSTSPNQKRAPKLQRHSTPEWPLQQLPSVPPISDDARPLSSDGIAPRRPRFQSGRRSSQLSHDTTNTAPIVDGNGRSVSYGRSGKKKKFQGLRRVFGLTD